MKRSMMALLAGSLLAVSFAAFAGPGAIEGVEKQPMNVSAIAMFMVFVLATLGITKWAAAQTKSTADFYTAGGGITGFQNGLAIAGDYMSAATLLQTAPAPLKARWHAGDTHAAHTRPAGAIRAGQRQARPFRGGRA